MSRILQRWIWAGDPCQCRAAWMLVRVILMEGDANWSGLSETQCECGRGGWAHVCLQQAWSGMPGGATGHVSEDSDVIFVRKKEQGFCGALIVSSLSSDFRTFPLALCGEFCNLILLREAYFQMCWCGVTPSPVLLKPTSGAIFISRRGRSFSLSPGDIPAAAAVCSATAGLEAERKAEAEAWTQQEFRGQSHGIADDRREAAKPSSAFQVLWQVGWFFWQYYCRTSVETLLLPVLMESKGGSRSHAE